MATIPADAKYGFWVAVGVLAALAAWHILSSRVPALS
jgi:hypothetical protein